MGCEELISRMAPVVEDMPGASWQEIVKECFLRGIDLTARGM